MAKTYFKNLDALRFIAFFAIFCHHGFHIPKNSGFTSGIYSVISFVKSPASFGVPFFFVLSGFLITYLLLKEKSASGKINIYHFYIRRILRIWPLYYLVVIFGFFIFPVLRSYMGMLDYSEPASLINYMLFLSNFDQIINGLPYGAGLGVTWSLSIEEQFYLIWPIIVYIVPKRHFGILNLLLITISLVFNYGFGWNDSNTLISMKDLAVGGFLAWIFIEKPQGYLMQKIKTMSKVYHLLIYLLFIFLIYLYTQEYVWFLWPLLRLGISFFFAYVIYEQIHADHSVFKFGKIKFFEKWGKYTYGLYLLHTICNFIIYNALKKVDVDLSLKYLLMQPLLSFLLTLIIGKLSFKYFEMRFLKLKSRFSQGT